MKKIIAMVVIILLIVGAVGSYYYYGQIKKPVLISTSQDNSSYCENNGANGDIYLKNTITYGLFNKTDRTPNIATDYCSYSGSDDWRSGLLVERSCKGDVNVEQKYSCGFGSICRDGRCIIGGDKNSPICSETDNGNDPDNFGEVVHLEGFGRDECALQISDGNNLNDNVNIGECVGEKCLLKEGYCEGDLMKTQIIKATTGCKNGELLR